MVHMIPKINHRKLNVANVFFKILIKAGKN